MIGKLDGHSWIVEFLVYIGCTYLNGKADVSDNNILDVEYGLRARNMTGVEASGNVYSQIEKYAIKLRESQSYVSISDKHSSQDEDGPGGFLYIDGSDPDDGRTSYLEDIFIRGADGGEVARKGILIENCRINAEHITDTNIRDMRNVKESDGSTGFFVDISTNIEYLRNFHYCGNTVRADLGYDGAQISADEETLLMLKDNSAYGTGTAFDFPAAESGDIVVDDNISD